MSGAVNAVAVEARSLAVAAGDFRLREVSFALPAGTWAMVLGAPGSGKTTLLEAIAGVRPVAGGRVLLRGADVTGAPPERRGIGIVYQHAFLFPHLTVRDNVAYGARGDSAAAGRAAARTGADRLTDRTVDSLSGGERQLVALARALAPEPDILLLDEPFTALDRRRRMEMGDVVRQLRRERPALTILQVTHDADEAVRVADRLLVMDAGVLVQHGTASELRTSPASGAVADLFDPA